MYRRHGLARGDRHLLNTWKAMVARCTRVEFPSYKNYGARGIRIHEPWLDDPLAFATWLNENLGPRPEGQTLDRIDGDGHYEPGNLRWASRQLQAANRKALGAELNTRTGRWQARICTNGVRRNLGTFDTKEEAHTAYLEAKGTTHVI